MTTKTAALFSACLLQFSATLFAQTVKLKSVIHHPDGSGPAIQRVYEASSAQHPRFKFVFKAESAGTGIWYLSMHALLPRQADWTVFGRDEILGPDGLLSKCIDRFMADEPGAQARAVDFEAVTSGPLWAGVMGNLAPLYKKWDGKVVQPAGDEHSPSASDADLARLDAEGDAVKRTLRRSPQLEEAGRKIAGKLNERLVDVKPMIGDGMLDYDFDLKHTTWGQRLKLPNYGIAVQSVFVVVELKPKQAAGKSK